jgi:hypothetical protein
MREEMMQSRLAINAVMLVLSTGVSVQTAMACSKEAVAGAVDRWTTVLAENNPDTIVALYSKDAVLWGTLYLCHVLFLQIRPPACLTSQKAAPPQGWAEPGRPSMPLYWLCYRHHNQVSVVIEPGASLIHCERIGLRANCENSIRMAVCSSLGYG